MNKNESSPAGSRLLEKIERLGASVLAQRMGVAKDILYGWAEQAPVPMEQLLRLGEEGADVAFVLTGETTELRDALGDIKTSTQIAGRIGGSSDEIARNQARIHKGLRASRATRVAQNASIGSQ